MKQIHVIHTYESPGDNGIGASPAQTLYVESDMSSADMQKHVLGRGLSSLADTVDTVRCSTIQVMSLDEFEAANPVKKAEPKRRLLSNKKRRSAMGPSISKKRVRRPSS